jgi:DNA-binding PadR family transcriptional regulator
MKTKPSTQYALLGALMSGPKHGYDIMQFLDTAFGSTWHVGTSQLYILLKKLERDNLVNSGVEIQNTRPSKRIFSLTSAGKKVFMDWLKSPTEHVRDLRIEFLAKLFFFKILSLEGGNELIRAQVQTLKQMKKKLEGKKRSERDPFKKLVFGYKMMIAEACLQWIIEEGKPFIRSSYGGRAAKTPSKEKG